MNCRSSGPPRPAEEEEGSALAEGTPPVTARAVHSSAEDAAMGCSGASGGAGPAQKPTAPGGSVVGARPKAAPADAAAVDADNSGFIDYTEFIVATVNTDEFNSNEFLQAAFKMFDKDGSGSISADEMGNALWQCGAAAYVPTVL